MSVSMTSIVQRARTTRESVSRFSGGRVDVGSGVCRFQVPEGRDTRSCVSGLEYCIRFVNRVIVCLSVYIPLNVRWETNTSVVRSMIPPSEGRDNTPCPLRRISSITSPTPTAPTPFASRFQHINLPPQRIDSPCGIILRAINSCALVKSSNIDNVKRQILTWRAPDLGIQGLESACKQAHRVNACFLEYIRLLDETLEDRVDELHLRFEEADGRAHEGPGGYRGDVAATLGGGEDACGDIA